MQHPESGIRFNLYLQSQLGIVLVGSLATWTPIPLGEGGGALAPELTYMIIILFVTPPIIKI